MLKLVVLSCMVAAATASVLAPFAPLAYTAPLAYAAPLLAPYGNNYRGPLSLAPGQPANIIAADGRPLDTLDVNLDRSAHYTAKAFEGGVHFLKKRSVALIAPLAYSAPLLAPYGHNYRGPLSLAPGQPANIIAADGRPLDTLDVNLDRSAHYTAKALEGGVHFLKKRSVALIAPLAYSAPLLAPYGHNYRGPLSLAPGQPANILAADGRPLDTLDVNLDRSAHFTAKALSGGIHYLKKRSASLIVPLGHVIASPLIHRVPLAYSAPVLGSRLAVAPIAYSAAPIAHYTHW